MHPGTERTGAFALALVCAGALLACAEERGTQSPAATGNRVQITVFAASSLREVFTGAGADFEAVHPDVAVRFSFAGSQVLRAQLQQGARAELFAPADDLQLQPLRAAGKVHSSRSLICNELVLVAPKANPAGLRTFAELPRASRIVLAASEVPAGHFADEVLLRAAALHGEDFVSSVMKNVVSRELNVRQALSKVTLGEVDAALVYRSDARAAGDRVVRVELPQNLQVRAEYPLAVLRPPTASSTEHVARAAESFVAFLTSPAAQARFDAAGFIRCDVPGEREPE